jgi:glycosyltransferase involved in cell wall biosynthesis
VTPAVPLRVLFLEPSALVTGGTIALLRLVSALDRRRIRPLVVLGSDGPLVHDFRRIPGCRVMCLPMPRGVSRVTRHNVVLGGIASAVSTVRYAARLRAIACKWRPHFIHSNGLKTHLLSLALPRRATLIWHIRDIIAPPYMPDATAAALRLLVRRAPRIVICNSAATARSIRLPASASQQVWTIPDGVACQAAAPRKRLGHPPRVVLLGRIAEWKGHRVFVKAAQLVLAEHPDTQFIIAGGSTTDADAAFAARLEREVEDAGLAGRIRFDGTVRDVPALLGETDILVHCSTSPEPFGQVIIEAMAAGVPVIASDAGAPPTIIADGVNGCLVRPGDSAALARAIAGLLADAPGRERLAAAASPLVRRRYSIDRTARRVAALYRRQDPVLTS